MEILMDFIILPFYQTGLELIFSLCSRVKNELEMFIISSSLLTKCHFNATENSKENIENVYDDVINFEVCRFTKNTKSDFRSQGISLRMKITFSSNKKTHYTLRVLKNSFLAKAIFKLGSCR